MVWCDGCSADAIDHVQHRHTTPGSCDHRGHSKQTGSPIDAGSDQSSTNAFSSWILQSAATSRRGAAFFNNDGELEVTKRLQR